MSLNGFVLVSIGEFQLTLSEVNALILDENVLQNISHTCTPSSRQTEMAPICISVALFSATEILLFSLYSHHFELGLRLLKRFYYITAIKPFYVPLFYQALVLLSWSTPRLFSS